MDNDSYTGKPAGFWIRFLAQLIDSVVLAVPSFVIFIFISFLFVVLMNRNGDSDFLISLVVPFCLGGISLLYYSLMTSKKGQTLGKMAFNIKVVEADGNPPSFGRSVGRWFSYILSAIPACIGYFLAAFDQEKRALHDRVTGTRVLYLGAPHPVALVITLVIGLGGAVLISSLAAVIILPNYMSMDKAAGLIVSKTRLQNIRDGILVYYTDKVAYPADLQNMVPKYMDSVPQTYLKDFGHSPSNQVETYPFLDEMGGVNPNTLKNTGHWLYDPKSGKVIIDCTDRDEDGKPIYTY